MPRCNARTQRGTRCRGHCSNGLNTCHIHADECPICLSGLAYGDDCSTLTCGHKFHAGCIYNWLDRDHRCPVCRTALRKPTLYVHFDFTNTSGTTVDDIHHILSRLYGDGKLNTDRVYVLVSNNIIRVHDYQTNTLIHTERLIDNMDS